MQPFTNQAQLSYNGITTASNIARGQIIEVLSVTKTAVTPDYSENSQEVYVISIVNESNTPFTGLTLEDDLGAYSFLPEGATEPIMLYPLAYVEDSLLYYINGEIQETPGISLAGGLTVTGIDIPAMGNATIVYAVRVTEFAPLDEDGEIINAATVTGPGLTLITATETIETNDEPLLSIIKTLSPDTVPGNGAVTYTFNILNRGNTPATEEDEVQITDTFDPVLANIEVSVNGDPLSPDLYTYDESTGLFTTVAGAITVPGATFMQNEQTGAYTVLPGETILTVSGNLG